MTINLNDVLPTNEQSAKAHLENMHLDDVYFSYQKNGCFYIVCVSGTCETGYKIKGVLHPSTLEHLAFPSRRLANRYCDIINAMVVKHA